MNICAVCGKNLDKIELEGSMIESSIFIICEECKNKEFINSEILEEIRNEIN